jgi:hypothetical protein
MMGARCIRSCSIAVLFATACTSATFGPSGGTDPSDARSTIDAPDGTDAPPGAPDAHPHVDARPGSPDAPVGTPDGPPAAGGLRFAIVGDTRPPNPDDTSNYPTAIITKIWQDIAAESPQPSFAVTTGDYMFASTSGSEQNPQLDLYLGARAAFPGTVYAAMGNHECTGATASNCGSGTTDGVTKNYTAFMTRMVQPNGFTEPYYVVDVNDPGGTWTAKFVFVAGNAWTSTQSSWLDNALSQPTTYTFVIRHEGVDATTAPGVSPSGTIIAKHPLTLLIVGHTHTYAHYSSDHEVICGNGGAPLTSGNNYGYAVVDRRADGAIQLTEYDYSSHAVLDQFAVTANGATTSVQ